jgi:hypothetical protein
VMIDVIASTVRTARFFRIRAPYELVFPTYESQMSQSESTAPPVYLLAIPCGKNTRRASASAAEDNLHKLIWFLLIV